MRIDKIDYRDGEVALEGHLALPSYDRARKPAVLVVHAFRGQDDFARDKAEALADLGYVGFAVDVYGKGVLADTPGEAGELMRPFLEDRAMLRRRLLAGLEAVQGHPRVDETRMGAIGFCFGGLCVLDLARAGADLRGVVSFHGLLHPSDRPKEEIRAKVLVLHGHDDPMVPPDQVAAFQKEMTDAGVDWQLHAYGHTKHAFTNPVARDEARGTVFQEEADRRSWASMRAFFEETLA